MKSSINNKTKKFLSKVLPEVSEVNDTKISNFDVYVNTASNISVVGKLVENVGRESRKSLQELVKVTQEATKTSTANERSNNHGVALSENDLKAFQNNFISNVLENSDINDIVNQDVKNMHLMSLDSLIKKGTVTSALSSKPKLSRQNNKAIPEIDFVDVVTNSNGLIDRFCARIVFTMSRKDIEDNKIKAIRIFRAKKQVPESSRLARMKLSRLGMDELRQPPTRTRNKNSSKEDLYHKMRLENNNVENSLTNTIKFDEFTGNLTAKSKESETPGMFINNDNNTSSNGDEKNLIALSSFLSIRDLGNIDASVTNDLNTIKNIRLQNPNLSLSVTAKELIGQGVVGRDSISNLRSQHIKNIRSSTDSSSNTDIIANKIYQSYKELMIVPISRLKSRAIGNDIIEFTSTDVTVELGCTYTYYITSLDDEITESIRSKIVKVNIEHNVPPRPPKFITSQKTSSTITLSIMAYTDDLIEKFEIYRKNLNTNIPDVLYKKIKVINGKDNFTVSEEERDSIGNGFIQIGESINTKFGGSTFCDKTAISGKKYLYRIYAVNIFNIKSQMPKELSIYYNNSTGKIVDIRKPTISAEIDQTTKKIKITIECDDDRIKAFFLARKNLTIHERGFSIPAQSSYIKLGLTNPRSIGLNFNDPELKSYENAWSGHFINDNNETISFVDNTTRFDNTYQYSVHGVDRFGNKTSYAITKPIFISRRPRVSRPLNVTAVVNGNTVKILWDDGNIDLDPIERLGDRDKFEKNLVKTLFQVERKKINDERWESFPITENKSIEDKIPATGEIAPTYRPPYLEVDSEYLYKVASFQSGGFISNFAEPIIVKTFIPVSQPSNFIIKSSGIKSEPFWIALNWDTPDESGTVDKWRIERAAINNFAASKLNVTNPEDIEKLDFEFLIDIFKEASRSRSREMDNVDQLIQNNITNRQDMTKSFIQEGRTIPFLIKKNSELSGQHHFIDNDVSLGNTYFYKISSIGLNSGNISVPLIRGIKISDTSNVAKLNEIMTQTERNTAAASNKQLAPKVILRPTTNVKTTLPFKNTGSEQVVRSKVVVESQAKTAKVAVNLIPNFSKLIKKF